MKKLLFFQKLTLSVSLSLIFLSVSASTYTTCDMPECHYETAEVPPMSLFSVNDNPVPTIGRAHLIKNPNDTECYMNLTTALQDFDIDKEQLTVGVFALMCYTPYLVHLTEYEDEYMSNTWFYFQMQGCETTTQSLSRLSRAVDLRVITSHKSYINTNMAGCGYQSADDECSALLNTSSVWITSSSDFPEQNFTELFSCNEVFPKMTEVSVDSMSWQNIPSMFQKKFPNLQSLEMPKCKLLEPPQFPWAVEKVTIPDNLTMGPYFLEQYANVYHVTLNPRLYRRILNLNSNSIRSLSNFSFAGYLQMIRLKNNKFEELGEQTFSLVEGLQHIDLSENRLSSLPKSVFHGLSDLHHLDLQDNKFEHLHPDVFKTLKELRFINLANNSLLFLEEKLFTDLENIEKIYLQRNLLKTVAYTSFPVTSVTLTELHFDSNPLTSIPDIVFYVRNLKLASLRFTPIGFESLSQMADSLIWAYIADSVLESSSTTEIDFLKKPLHLKTIDLSNSDITTIKLNESMSQYQNRVLLLILKNFEFILSGNNLKCDCNIVTFSEWVYKQMENKALDGSEYFFHDWVCSNPIELEDRQLLQVQANETYCEKNITKCPMECVCYVRTNMPITIIDCRNQGLTRFPEEVPNGLVDLWFQNNNITAIEERDYFTWVRQMYLSHNAIEDILPEVLVKFIRLESVHLDSNLLADLPREIQDMPLLQTVLKNNPFRCDCRTLWMKKWLLASQAVVTDWMKISCNDASEQGRQFISVPDDAFICLEEFDSIRHVVTPSVSASVAVTAFLICLCLLHVYRYEVKVLIYIYTGFHPFDRDAKEGNEDVDVLVIHAFDTNEWVMENIVLPLENSQKSYVVCEISRDFAAGFSFQENIVSMVNKSKRMILVLSENMSDEDDLCKVAWNEAQEKIKELRTNYVIFVSHGFHKKKLLNKDLIRYVKRSRFIDSKDSFLREKILYAMPHVPDKDVMKERFLPNIRKCVLNMYDNHKIANETRDAYIVYSDNARQFAVNDLRIFLEKNKYELILADRDFLPGASKEENILRAVSTSHHTIFIMSDDHLEDEWSLFTFRTAVEKSLREKCNHLIVLTLNANENNIRDEEVRHYLKTHVVLDINGHGFWKRLKIALPSKDALVVENGVKENNAQGIKLVDRNHRDQVKVVVNAENVNDDEVKVEGITESTILRARVKEKEIEKEHDQMDETLIVRYEVEKGAEEKEICVVEHIEMIE